MFPSVKAAIWKELRAVAKEHPLAHVTRIRVTDDAIMDSPVAFRLPVEPSVYVEHDGSRTLRWPDQQAFEVLLHPEDFLDLLARQEPGMDPAIVYDGETGAIIVWGVPVVDEHPIHI